MKFKLNAFMFLLVALLCVYFAYDLRRNDLGGWYWFLLVAAVAIFFGALFNTDPPGSPHDLRSLDRRFDGSASERLLHTPNLSEK